MHVRTHACTHTCTHVHAHRHLASHLAFRSQNMSAHMSIHMIFAHVYTHVHPHAYLLDYTHVYTHAPETIEPYSCSGYAMPHPPTSASSVQTTHARTHARTNARMHVQVAFDLTGIGPCKRCTVCVRACARARARVRARARARFFSISLNDITVAMPTSAAHPRSRARLHTCPPACTHTGPTTTRSMRCQSPNTGVRCHFCLWH